MTNRRRRSPGLLTAGLLSALLLAGCIGQTREERLDPMVGQDVDVAIEALGQPDETVSLEDGRHAYVWERIYENDMERRTLFQADRHRPYWFEDEPAVVDARLCTTTLIVGFDFLIESWDYGCRTVEIEKDAWRARPLAPPHRSNTRPAN